MSDIKTFLEDLKQLNDKDCFDINVPSINKKISFKAFSVKQHKDMVKTVLNGVEGSILINKVLNDIIKTNSAVKDIEFKHYDRNKILVEMRRHTIGDKVIIDNTDYYLTDLPIFKFDFIEEKEFKYSGITVKMKVPTLDVDSKVTEKSVVEVAKFSSDEKKLGDSINALLVFELMKFIQLIQIEDNIIDFTSQGTYDKKNIIDNLPLKLNNILLEFIANYKEYEQDLFTFGDGVKLNIDVNFLTNE